MGATLVLVILFRYFLKKHLHLQVYYKLYFQHFSGSFSTIKPANRGVSH